MVVSSHVKHPLSGDTKTGGTVDDPQSQELVLVVTVTEPVPGEDTAAADWYLSRSRPGLLRALVVKVADPANPRADATVEVTVTGSVTLRVPE